MTPTHLQAFPLLAFFILGVAAPGSAGEQDERAAVPESAAQKAAKASILEVFKEEYRQRSASAKRDLAKKLLEQSADTAGDVATRYVLLDEARDLAVEAGECGLAVEAIRGLAKHFKVEGPELEYDALSRLRRKARTVEDHKLLAKAFLDLVDESIRFDDFETARRAVGLAGNSARSAKDVNLANRVRSKVKEVSKKKRAFEKIDRAMKTLEKTPDDADANSIVGRYECFEKGNWDKGLVMLQKGSDKTLAELAKKDLAKPSDPTEAVAVGDGWWAQAEGKEWAVMLLLHKRAAQSYERVIEDLAGLDKTKVKKRLTQFREEMLGPAELWNVVDVSGGKREGDAVTVSTAPNSANSAPLQLPSEPVDAVSVRVRVTSEGGVSAGIQFEGKQRAVYLAGGSSIHVVHVDPNDPLSYVRDHVAPVEQREEVVLTLVMEEGEYRFLVDGVEITRIDRKTDTLGVVSLYVANGPARFDRIKVRKRQ